MPPEVEILVNPIMLDCAVPEETIMEFLGKIMGGKPPYSIGWKVLDPGEASDLHRPAVEKLEIRGHSSVILLDQAPEYMVVFQVTDACGQENEARVVVACEETIKKSDNLFFQQNRRLPGTPHN